MNKIKNILITNKELIDKSLKMDNTKWNEKITLNEIINGEKLKISLLENKTYLIIYRRRSINYNANM